MDKMPLSKQILSIPNVLSLFRIALIPLFIWRYLTADTMLAYAQAAAIIALSGISDMLDGLIARKFGMITELGKALDPFADKLTQCALIFCLITRFPLMKGLVVLFLVKEISIACFSFYLYKKGNLLHQPALFFLRQLNLRRFSTNL